MIAWLASAALAQGIQSSDLEDCVPRVIGGTPGAAVTEQATATNAQAYGAVALAEGVLLGRNAIPAAFRMSAIYGVNRLPTLAVCPTSMVPGMGAMDLVATSAGLSIPIALGDDGLLRIIYAGSITATLMHFPSRSWANNRVLTTEAMALAGVGLGYAPFLAPAIDRTSGPQSIAGDGIVGAQLFNPWDPELGALTVGYVLSSGLYTNVSVDRVKVLASALLTRELSDLALARLGFAGLVVAEALGQTHTYARRKLLQPPPRLQADGIGDSVIGQVPSIALHSVHLEQYDIGGVVDVAVAGAVAPDVFLHEGFVGVHDQSHFVDLRLGITELPAMPWYDVDGGRRVFYDLRAFMGVVRLSRNTASTLTDFPYAQDAIHFELGVSDEVVRAFRQMMENR